RSAPTATTSAPYARAPVASISSRSAWRLVPDPETSTTRRLGRSATGSAATVGPFLGERLHGRRHSALYIHTNASGPRIRGSLRSGRPSATIPAHRAAPAGRGRGRK